MYIYIYIYVYIYLYRMNEELRMHEIAGMLIQTYSSS